MKKIALLACGWNNSGKGFISKNHITSLNKSAELTFVHPENRYHKHYLVDIYHDLNKAHDEVKVINFVRDPRIAWGCSLDRFNYRAMIKNVISYLNHIMSLQKSLDILEMHGASICTVRFEDLLFDKKILSDYLGDNILVDEESLKGFESSKYFSRMDLERGNPALFAIFYSREEFDAFQEGRHLFEKYCYSDSFCDVIEDILRFINPAIFMNGMKRVAVGAGPFLEDSRDVEPYIKRTKKMKNDPIYNRMEIYR